MKWKWTGIFPARPRMPAGYSTWDMSSRRTTRLPPGTPIWSSAVLPDPRCPGNRNHHPRTGTPGPEPTPPGGPPLLPLHHHRKPHAPRRADGEQPEVLAAPAQLLEQLNGDPRAGGAEGVADGDGAAVDVEALEVHHAERL